MAKDKFNFDVVLSNLEQNELNLAKELAGAQRNYFMESFKRQAWNNKPWQKVKYRKPTNARGITKPILVLRGILRRAVNNSIKRVTRKEINFEVNLPYARIHNEGGIMKNGARMPKRQYMGWNKDIDKINRNIINKYIKRSMQ